MYRHTGMEAWGHEARGTGVLQSLKGRSRWTPGKGGTDEGKRLLQRCEALPEVSDLLTPQRSPVVGVHNVSAAFIYMPRSILTA